MPDVLDYHSKPPRRSRRQYVWRAARYLGPYKRLVVASIACAFLAGGIFFSGLGAVLPVMKVLLDGDTPQMWVDRMVAEERWGIDIADDPRVVEVEVSHGMANGWGAGTRRENLAYLLRQDPRDVVRFLASGDADEAKLALESRLPPLSVTVPSGGTSDVPRLWVHQAEDASWHLRLLRRVVYLLPSNPVSAVAAIMACIFVLSAIANAFRFIQEYLSNKASLSAINDIRRELYDHSLRAPLSYFGKTGTGDVTSRIVGDCAQLQEGFRVMLGRAVQEPIFAAFAFAFALWMDWRLTLFVIAFAPVMVVVLRRFGKKMRRAGRATLQQNAELLGQVESTLAGVRVVKANNAEAAEVDKIRGVLGRLLDRQMSLAKYDAMNTPVMETLAVLAVGVIFTVATYLVRVDQTLSAAQALLVFGALIQIAESLRRISKLNIVLQRTNAAGERVFEAIDTPTEADRRSRRSEEAKREAKTKESVEPEKSTPEEKEEKGSGAFVALTSSGGRSGFAATKAPDPFSPAASSRLRDLRHEHQVAFENVTFSYNDNQPPAVDGVSLEVSPGESVAVVGRNGSGKTTLLSLLPRFYEPTGGRITIDGTDIRDVPLNELRRLVGIVTQEAVVFPGTIRDNLAYGRPQATQAEVEDAARQAEAHEFILQKPGGYDFSLTGLGGQLSGGQRQRINIARAILRDPPILILDEATSQVDAESEHLIQGAISRLMKGRTTFVIAHRFSTILDCDRIALLEQGRLEAVGTHDELLASNETYQQLYERQLVAS
jgi:ABC-type multidrug transport system fused ATPase/permease subunit